MVGEQQIIALYENSILRKMIKSSPNQKKDREDWKEMQLHQFFKLRSTPFKYNISEDARCRVEMPNDHAATKGPCHWKVIQNLKSTKWASMTTHLSTLGMQKYQTSNWKKKLEISNSSYGAAKINYPLCQCKRL